MKKLILSLIITAVFSHASVGNVINNGENSLRKKNGWYYAGCDATGAYAGVQGGAALGPLGIAAGGVLGGNCSLVCAYHVENRLSGIVPIINPKIDFLSSYNNDSEKAGFLHNKFVIEIINNQKLNLR